MFRRITDACELQNDKKERKKENHEDLPDAIPSAGTSYAEMKITWSTTLPY